ncbi:MAG TPA: LOG family protein [Thermoanaerobaculia bacterium]|nr:LOG family protein [Thermoanaerobaculia bacterium]
MRVAVFGSSLPKEGEPAYETARDLGREIARRGAGVVCGGYGGVMEAVCRGAAEAGGKSTGVVLRGRGEPNRFVTEAIAVEDLSERLRHLRDLPDAWIFLPRGLGTMLELVWIAESIVKGETRPRPFVCLGSFWGATVSTIRSEAAGSGVSALTAAVRFAEGPAEAASLALSESRSSKA